MKIRKLSIKNYKIFDEVEFDFTDLEGKTLDTVVLAGVNGCGKTTVLELIKNVFSGPNGSTETLFKIEYEFNEFEKQRIKDKKIDVHDNYLTFFEHSSGGNIPLGIYGVDDHTKICYFPIKKDIAPTTRKGFLVELHIDADKSYMKRIALKEIRDLIFKNRNTPPHESIQQHIQKITLYLKGMGLQSRLVDLESEELIFESSNGKRIYFEHLSHGEQSLYFRAIYLAQLNLNNGIIMVDEPEAAFHPSWQQKIAQLFRNTGENNQVFLATHSPHIMASVPPECLFVLHVEEETRKIKVINMAKAGKHSQGVEPNRILREIMQVESLRGYETQRDIDRLTSLLTPEQFESAEAQQLIEKLTEQLGRQDSFIIRLEHQLLMLNRKKQTLVTAQ